MINQNRSTCFTGLIFISRYKTQNNTRWRQQHTHTLLLLLDTDTGNIQLLIFHSLFHIFYFSTTTTNNKQQINTHTTNNDDKRTQFCYYHQFYPQQISLLHLNTDADTDTDTDTDTEQLCPNLAQGNLKFIVKADAALCACIILLRINHFAINLC